MVKWTTNGAIFFTGAAQRVGLHCLHRLVEQGERVVITYRTHRPVIDELRALGVTCIQADFNRQQDIDHLIRQLHGSVGPLRAIVHNASAWLRDVNTQVDHVSVMQAMMQVHMMAPYLINLNCRELLLDGRQAWADIIHVTDYVVEKGSDNHIAYAASKAGLDNMTRSFAKRYAPHIKVNAIAPSLLMFNEGDTEEYRARTLHKSPIGIEPGPEVVYQALEFILDNAYMTGRELKLDGGRHIR